MVKKKYFNLKIKKIYIRSKNKHIKVNYKTPQILSAIGCYNNIRFLNLALVIGKL